MKYTISIILNICFSLTILASTENIEKISYLNTDSINEVERVLRDYNIEDSLLTEEDTHLSNIKYTDLKSTIIRDSIFISYNAVVPFSEIKSAAGLYIIPVYRSKGKQFFFKKVIVNGKDRNNYYLREQNIKSHKRYFSQKPYSVSVLKDSNDVKISYSIARKIPMNMDDNGVFTLEEIELNCSGLNIHAIRKIAQSIVLSKKNLAFVRPPKHELKIKPKNIPLTLDFTINYEISSNKILRNFSENLREFNKIQTTLGNPVFDNQFNIQSVTIVGSASPESDERYNKKLSLRRALILEDYLLKNFKFLKNVKFYVEGIGENWEGLKEKIELGDLEKKDTLISIINNDSITNKEKEIRFRKVSKGKTYDFIKKNYFPSLRRMNSKIVYFDKKINRMEAIKEIRRENISHQEIFDFALDKNDMKMMKQTVLFFPNSKEAYNNAAAAELLNGKPDLALKYLEKIWDEEIAYNNIGLYYLLIGNNTEGKKYLNMSIRANTNKEKAEFNLKLLDKYNLK